jgi:hypothetical protein
MDFIITRSVSKGPLFKWYVTSNNSLTDVSGYDQVSRQNNRSSQEFVCFVSFVVYQPAKPRNTRTARTDGERFRVYFREAGTCRLR